MKPIALLLGLLLIAGCSTTPEPGPSTADTTPVVQASADALLSRAQRSQEPERSQLLLQAAREFSRQRNFAATLSTLQQVDVAQLAHEQQEEFVLLGAQASVEAGQGSQALGFLNRAKLPLFQRASLSTQQQLSELRARAYLLQGDALLSAMERIFAAGLYTGDAYWRNHELIWSALTQVPTEELQVTREETPEPDLRGWVDLALQLRRQPATLDNQLEALAQWRQAHPGHPAARRLPEELHLLSTVRQERPRQIALTLPLSGPLAGAGAAIRDGFLAAYYADPHRDEQQVEIQILDTTRYASYTELYQQLTRTPLDLVVGPLDKNAVTQLEQLPQLSVPVLALNYTDTPGSQDKPLYQFGLAIEDEITQAVEQAWNSGHRRAVIIVPDSGPGQRAQQAFAQAWRQRGGTVLESTYLGPDGDYSAIIKELLAVAESEQRSREIAQAIGEPVKSDPRRRRDIDVIFLAAPPILARQINPLLAYHYGGDIPIYGTSQVFAGQVNPERDQDLNGIRFLDLPWVLRQDLPIKQQTASAWPAQLQDRLYALGVDAYRLAPRLNLMRQFNQSALQGMTGYLFLNNEQKIRRRLDWAQFQGGRPRPLTDATAATP